MAVLHWTGCFCCDWHLLCILVLHNFFFCCCYGAHFFLMEWITPCIRIHHWNAQDLVCCQSVVWQRSRCVLGCVVALPASNCWCPLTFVRLCSSALGAGCPLGFYSLSSGSLLDPSGSGSLDVRAAYWQPVPLLPLPSPMDGLFLLGVPASSISRLGW